MYTTITPGLIKRIKQTCPGGYDEDDWVASEIEAVRRIGQELLKIHEQSQKEEERHQQEIKKLEQKRINLMRECNHYDNHYCHGGPYESGEYCCDICGITTSNDPFEQKLKAKKSAAKS